MLAQAFAFSPLRNNHGTNRWTESTARGTVQCKPGSALSAGGAEVGRDLLSEDPTAESAAPVTRYTWRGHSCAYRKMGAGPPVLLVHGFAGSSFNCWRSTLPELARTHTTYAIDLLGLGASDQPADVDYGIGLWTEQCEDFVRDHMGAAPPVVIGHSFGSCVALELASALGARGTPARAVAMMNCGCGMNNKNGLAAENWRREQDPDGAMVEAAAPAWQFAVFGLVLGIVDVVFSQKWLLLQILGKFATAENVRGALESSVYTDPGRVTDDLVADYLELAKNKNAAVEVLRQIYTNDAGPLPFPAAEALPEEFPVLAVWGDRDNLASIQGPVGRYFRDRARRLGATRFEEISAGHVPQDDAPGLTNRILSEWLVGID